VPKSPVINVQIRFVVGFSTKITANDISLIVIRLLRPHKAVDDITKWKLSKIRIITI